MNRALAVTRMHLTDRLTLFGLPPAILAASFFVNLLVFAVEPVDARSTGGMAAIYIVVIVAAVMCTARGLSFALSMGASRRAFVLGTFGMGALLSVVFGLLMFVLNRIESASNGWGLRGRFFRLSWFTGHNPATVWLLLTVPFLAIFLAGVLAATIWLRWRGLGMLVGGVALVIVFGGAVALITWRHGWGGIGDWFAALTPLTTSGWVALACLPLAGASYLTVRRVSL